MTLIEPQAGVGTEPTPHSIDRAKITAALATVVEATGQYLPEPGQAPRQAYKAETLVTTEIARLVDVADEIKATMLKNGTLREDGSVIMSFDAVCADIINRHDISKADIIMGVFFEASTHEITQTSDGLLVLAPELA